MWPFNNKTDTSLYQAATTLSPFISSALSGLKKQELSGQSGSRMLAECYVYGAIRYLASYDEMHPDTIHSLMESMFSHHFEASDEEIIECLKIFTEVKDGEKEKLFMKEGAGALRRWLVNNDQSAANDLKSLIKMSSW